MFRHLHFTVKVVLTLNLIGRVPSNQGLSASKFVHVCVTSNSSCKSCYAVLLPSGCLRTFSFLVLDQGNQIDLKAFFVKRTLQKLSSKSPLKTAISRHLSTFAVVIAVLFLCFLYNEEISTVRRDLSCYV